FDSEGGAGEWAIGLNSTQVEALEIIGPHASTCQRPLCRAISHLGIALPLFQHPPLFDAGANGDPLVARVDHLFQIFVRDHLVRQLRASTQDNASPLRSAHSPLLKTTQAFVPPKPNELDNTTRMSAFRA